MHRGPPAAGVAPSGDLAEFAAGIVESLPDPVAVLDREGRFRAANAAFCRTFGLSAAAAGREPDAGSAAAELGARLREALEGRTHLAEHLIAQALPGAGRRFLRVTARPLGGADRADGLTLVTLTDVTEQRRAEAALDRYRRELERSNAALQEFADVASHDLREPMRKVLTFGDRLRAKFGSVLGPEGNDYLERALNAARRMQGLIDALLDYSRVSIRPEAFQPVDLNRVAQEVLRDLEVRTAELDADVAVGPLPVIHADPLQMRQLFQNLLANSLKFHRPEVRPTLRVDATCRADVVELRFRDNGIGFDDKDRERIFGAFQRLHPRSRYEGNGIGLALCRRIAERHGGTIAASGAPGLGATFIVTLPLEHTPPASITEDSP